MKWGQPAYLTSETRSGSTIRVAATEPGSKHDHAMYFICHTNLVEAFRDLFGDVFTYEGHRALLFKVSDEVPDKELRECVAMALTYHRPRSYAPGRRFFRCFALTLPSTRPVAVVLVPS